MLYRNAIFVTFVPLVVIAALLVVVAPACTMPGCGSFVGLAAMADSGCGHCATDHGCEEYMMVNDTPDGVTTPTAPVIAVISTSETPEPVCASASLPTNVKSPMTPEYDPLGVRIRV